MLALLKLKLPEVLQAVVPLFAVVCAFQLMLVHAPLAVFLQFLVGALLALVGMLLLLAGIDFGILPMGRFIGAELPKKGSLWLIVGVAFALGFATTAAEPDVLILSGQVARASDGAMGGQTLVYVIAGGVGVFAALALLRVVVGFSMIRLLTVVFLGIILISFVSPETFIPIAYDAGSVTTGVLTAPVLLAVTLGLSSVLGERSAVADGFGLLGVASAGPIFVILLLGLLLS
jgi:hypothetical protein